MAKVRSHVVSRASCAVVAARARARRAAAREPPGPESAEPARLVGNRNVLAAVLEAAMAALYLEHGFAADRAAAIVEAFESRDRVRADAQRRSQDRAAGGARPARQVRQPTSLLASEGPPHERTFTAAVLVDGEQAGVGQGGSKKDAEQEAAREALEGLGCGSRRSPPE